MKWISVNDRLPERGSQVLACYKGGYVGVLHYIEWMKHNEIAWIEDGYNVIKDVTHWQPLPKPPAPPLSMKGYFISKIDYGLLCDTVANLSYAAPDYNYLTQQLLDILALVREKELRWMLVREKELRWMNEDD